MSIPVSKTQANGVGTRRVIPCLVLALACALGSSWLLGMPDGSGRVHALSPKLQELQEAAAGKLAAVLARDPAQRLTKCVRHAEGQLLGAETVAPPSRNGSLYVPDRDGSVYRFDPVTNGSYVRTATVANLGRGRPLGYILLEHTEAALPLMESFWLLPDSPGPMLIVADALQGLVQLELGSGKVSLLTPLHSANDLDVDPTDHSKMYFSVSTTFPVELVYGDDEKPRYDTMDWYFRCAARGDTTGRLLSYNRKSGKTAELVTGLSFANGVAVSADGSFVLVVESNGFRILRVWVRGKLAGNVETFAQGLPGFPDSMSRSADGKSFFVAIIAPHTPALKLMRSRLARGLLARLPRWLVHKLKVPLGLVLQLRASDGEVIGVFADAETKHVRPVSI
ncbi:hypothetical protein T492DRAFT_899056 [Pavlovales sp. CCMP2436]|nr:hypothetical protein T492DRAFT_899056 [Pavlovales sp. CCMP2436]